MTERLALPAWDTAPTQLAAWVTQLESQGLTVAVTRDSASLHWLEVSDLRLRGYAVTEGRNVEAINFELADPDPDPALQALETAAAALAWELHEDEDDGEDDDD